MVEDGLFAILTEKEQDCRIAPAYFLPHNLSHMALGAK